MIIKSFSHNEIKESHSRFYLMYGENEGLKNEVIQRIFLKDFQGELIKYDENQILENKELFFEACLNESLFEKKKLIIVSRVTTKLYEIIKDLSGRKVNDKKFIFKSKTLEKKSKVRQLFEKDKDLVCIPFYEDNSSSLYKVASEFFKKNNISISSENINLIVDKCSGDRQDLKNEMNKIYNFCLNKNKISRTEILKLINSYENENYFELIDNCLSKNRNKVNKIINEKIFNNNDAIILIRFFITRIKRLIELKKLQSETGSIKETVNNFRPPIFWKDKEIVEKQVEIWPTNKIFELLDHVNILEISYKKNSNLSNNLIFDFILNTSNS